MFDILEKARAGSAEVSQQPARLKTRATPHRLSVMATRLLLTPEVAFRPVVRHTRHTYKDLFSL